MDEAVLHELGRDCRRSTLGRSVSSSCAQAGERLGGGSFDMVAMFEIAFLIVVVVLGVWWFRRTNLYRARSSRSQPRQGVDPNSRLDPPNHGTGGTAW
jgi:hypothetical protein